jgi:hypothetical protein
MKNKKPLYETPVIIPLGELAKGHGAPCGTGSGANPCGTGIGASQVKPPKPDNCPNGQQARLNCGKGSGIGHP